MNQNVSRDQVLASVKAAYGFVPNVMSLMAEYNPAVAQAYLSVGAVLEAGVLTPAERQVVMLAVSAFNDCHYCTAAHRTVARGMGVAQADLNQVDAQKPPNDARLRSLTDATWAAMRERGWLDSAARARLNLSTPEYLELVAIIGMKTISNYVNHMLQTEVDAPLKEQATRKPRTT